MQFQQHVYGRVAKGYRSGSPGYQLAALGETLADREDMIARLNKMSFFNLRDVKGGEARYSFYRPADGFLAFGCSRLSRDRTGSIGSFAHHFICEEKDFVRSPISPAALLQYLIENSKFLENETQLPSDRSLPPEEIEPSSLPERAPAFQTLAACIANLYLDKSNRTIPLVVTSDEKALEILTELFLLLPQVEAARLSFSTLFTEASDFTGNFRLVFIPESKYLPPDTYNYTIFDPVTQKIELPQTPVDLIRFSLEAPGDYEAFLKLIHILRHAPEEHEEAGTLFERLITHRKLFRDCLESLETPRIFELILRKKDWIVAYGHSGKPLNYADLSPVVWKDQDAYLAQLLLSIDDLGQQRFADDFLRDLAQRIAMGQTSAKILGELTSRGLEYFFDLARALSVHERCWIAEKLREKPFYKQQLHTQIARYLVLAIAEQRGQSWYSATQWLRGEEQSLRLESFSKAALAVALWAAGDAEVRPALSNYPTTDAEYTDLLEAVWAIAVNRSLSATDLDTAAFDPDHRRGYFLFLLRQFSVSKSQKAILSIIAKRYGAGGAHDQDLISAIERSSKASALAQHFLDELEKDDSLDENSRKTLKAIARKSSWGIFK